MIFTESVHCGLPHELEEMLVLRKPMDLVWEDDAYLRLFGIG
jgi:hypothetical protein